jgi:hypothetical protein
MCGPAIVALVAGGVVVGYCGGLFTCMCHYVHPEAVPPPSLK